MEPTKTIMLKGCVWACIIVNDGTLQDNVSVKNMSTIKIPRKTSKNQCDEYIGVGMDYGFRLASIAKQGNTIISPSLINLILGAAHSDDSKENSVYKININDDKLYALYIGTENLKGFNYHSPIFAICDEEKLIKYEHALLARDIHDSQQEYKCNFFIGNRKISYLDSFISSS